MASSAQQGLQPVIVSNLVCLTCGMEEAPARTLQRCAKCKLAHYCSRECQKSDWQKHKPECKSRRKNRELAKSEGIGEADTCYRRWNEQNRLAISDIVMGTLFGPGADPQYTAEMAATHAVVLSLRQAGHTFQIVRREVRPLQDLNPNPEVLAAQHSRTHPGRGPSVVLNLVTLWEARSAADARNVQQLRSHSLPTEVESIDMLRQGIVVLPSPEELVADLNRGMPYNPPF